VTKLVLFSFSIILAALQGTISTGSTNLVVIALDCLGKLISYNYVKDEAKAMEHVVDLICECFVGESTDEKIQLQIVKVTPWCMLIKKSW
jgi:brefeldin A-inhibited guanine nucleotide-exchange protein